ncbi:unnamed protein product [Ectocarpus fasciculatus]
MSKLSRVQSADLAVLSSDDWSSSSSGSSGSRTSSIATVEGDGGPLEQDPSSSFWLGDIPTKCHGKHPPDGQSNPSPKSTDTAWISNSSVGLLIGEGEEQPLQQQETPLTAWVDQRALGSGWEQVGEKSTTPREPKPLRSKHRRRKARAREERAGAAAVTAGDGDSAAAAAAAVGGSTKASSGRAVEAATGGKRAPPAPRPPGASSAAATAATGKGILVDGDHSIGAKDSHKVAVGKDGRLLRLSTCDFHTPTKEPQPSIFAATAAAEPEAGAGARAGAAAQRVGAEGAAARECQCCVSCGASGGGAAGTMREGAGERRRGEQPLGEPWDERKEGEQELLQASGHSLAFSAKSGYSAGPEEKRRASGGGLSAHGSRTFADEEGSRPGSSRSLYSCSSRAQSLRARKLRAENIVDGIDHAAAAAAAARSKLGGGTSISSSGSHRDFGGLGDSSRSSTSSLTNTGGSGRSTSYRPQQDSTGSERRRRGLLGGLKKGMGVVWEKIAADHPQPLPIDKTLTKEQQRQKHLHLERQRRNDWHTNSIAEQHVLRTVLQQEEEKVKR